ncbi:Zinc finger protein SNAI2 [Liparis tanakae]|uniref:Zinc finger protein SNAI2 n=1 Tax=Liparis tanakae TaxID=230148 RepID=A0A4Z2GDP2_9TELE|nr:Zinc finger protein SNAI2 [Liparis tanakae]
MPRSFLVKKHSARRPPAHGRPSPETADRLRPPSSPRASPLSPPEARGGRSADASEPAGSRTREDPDGRGVAGDRRRRESLAPSPLPLLALFPSAPSAAGRHECFECSDRRREHSSFSSAAKHKRLQCEWSGQKYFSCKYCEKEYVSLGALKMHIRTHTLPCVCKLCGKAFSRPWLLQGHIRTHTGEKPFSCLHCSRAFADRSNLRAHLQTHAEVKKYRCARCFKTFSRISLLAKHQEAGCPTS